MQTPDVEEPKQGPIKAKDVGKELLKPKLGCMPDLCSSTRRKLYLWYPGPELCGHRMHWTEYIFVVFLAAGVVFFIIGADTLPTIAIGGLTATVSVIALLFVWGFAKYKSLADAADRLERVAAQNHNEVCALAEINDDWESCIQENQVNQDQFASSMGLVTGDAEAIAELTDKLTNLVDAKRDLQNEEKVLFQTTIKVEEVTRREAREKEISVLKTKFERYFDRIDRRNHGGGKKSDGNLVGEEINEIRTMLSKDAFLNSVGEDGEPLYNWLPLFAKACDDGKMAKYEILNILELATNSYFIAIKGAFAEEAKLKLELRRLKSL